MDAARPTLEKNVSSDALEVDLRCALAFGRSALRALTLMSDEAGGQIDVALDEEIATICMDSPPGEEAMLIILAEMREHLRDWRAERERMIEARLVEAATEL
jgi:hypothetical protein